MSMVNFSTAEVLGEASRMLSPTCPVQCDERKLSTLSHATEDFHNDYHGRGDHDHEVNEIGD